MVVFAAVRSTRINLHAIAATYSRDLCPPPLVPRHHLLLPQKLGIVAQAGSTFAPLPQQQPDHLPMSNTTLASPPPPSFPSPLSTANTSPSLSSENFVSTTPATPAPSAFSPSLLRPLARFIAASVSFSSTFSYSSSFVATHLPGYDGILGKPFLTDNVNPILDWTTNSFTSPFSLAGDVLPQQKPQIHLLSAKRFAKFVHKHHSPQFSSPTSTAPAIELLKIYVSLATSESTASSSHPSSSHTFTSIKTHVDPAMFTPKTSLSPPQQAALHDLLHTHHHSTFDEPSAINADSLDTFDGYRHRIHLQPGSLPPTHRLYRMSPAELEELHKQLQIYLEKGWIRPSSSEYGAPVLFARKPDGSLCLCIDYRSLNAQTIKDRGPLPLTSELFDHLHGAKYSTSLDLWSGYHQCLIHPDDSHKTAFKTRYGLYEFTVMPFGLTNAPAAFMRQMSHVLKAYLNKFVVCYLDDVLIYSKTEAEHLQHSKLVLEAFDRCNLKVKLPKCSFATSSTRFLGYLVSSQGLAADPKKTAAVADWPLPSDITSVRSFLGFTGFFRRFIRDYAKIAAPLTDLTRSTVPFSLILPPSAVDSFNQLKTTLLSAPLLLIPHAGPDSTFILYTDASTLGLDAVLLQDQGQGPQPVCYEPRKLTPAECNYSTHELELLAIVHAVKIFRHYLEGCQHFTLFTDHHSLRYFFTQKDLSRRQVRWAQDLAVFQPNMSIIYKDAEPLLDDIKAAYALDPFYAESNPRRPKYLLCRDSLWYFKDRICVPSDPALRLRLLHEYHDTPTSGHPGYLKTLNSIASHYWWPRMTRTVKSYVSSCATCQRIKPSTQLPPWLLQPHTVPVRPWSHVSMDLITDLPKSQCHDTLSYDSIVTFVDILTKQAIFVRANKSITSQQLAHVFIDHVFSKHGLPSVIVSDRDPRQKSPIEPLNKSFVLTSLHSTTIGLHGYHLLNLPTTPIIRHQLDLAKARRETQANRSRSPLTFTVGDRVRLSSDHLTLVEYPSSKLRPRFLGPFTINKVISPVAYRLNLPAALSHIHPVFHVSRLLPWNDNPTSEFPQRDTPSQPLANPRDYVHNAHPVHSILDCRIQTDPDSRARPKSKCLFFKVRWSTPNPDQPIDTWEPMRSLTKLTAFKVFLSSPTWSTFVQTPAYLSFARLFKTKIPKVVHFAVLDDPP
ncbi:hypothetical protein CEUSTIGMA_g5833.t1 [Chlamydomonas eustigma]|uniref:Reverse transcriptase n=1 Tax=Chlamydomonas eustigma TaxID=1157962 RepID=A0A250X5N4_9CHLO|nr:hypothetical protein CEUSTIGMA_g5833.t1 [Chlamydomonas eustigma]|eukprot:GAX78391.1 hypothetical protein CEUSTIGMA_g5833.t1 [Chlamydomonas eustigma]